MQNAKVRCSVLKVLEIFYKNKIGGVDGGEDPPVPIPNTEVKLTSVDNTWLATAREDRATPSQMKSKAQINPCASVLFLS